MSALLLQAEASDMKLVTPPMGGYVFVRYFAAVSAAFLLSGQKMPPAFTGGIKRYNY